MLWSAHTPRIDPTAFVVDSAVVIGDVVVGAEASIWFRAVVEAECLIAAGALVTPGTHVGARSLVLGSPAKRVRDLTADELAHLRRSAAGYVAHAAAYRAQDLR